MRIFPRKSIDGFYNLETLDPEWPYYFGAVVFLGSDVTWPEETIYDTLLFAEVNLYPVLTVQVGSFCLKKMHGGTCVYIRSIKCITKFQNKRFQYFTNFVICITFKKTSKLENMLTF